MVLAGTAGMAHLPAAVPMRKRPVAEIRRLQAEPDRPPAALPSASHQIHHYLRLVAAVGASAGDAQRYGSFRLGGSQGESSALCEQPAAQAGS